MARLSYRNKVLIKKIARIFSVLLVLVLIGGFLTLIYYEPYMVYGRGNAELREGDKLQPVQVQHSDGVRPNVGEPRIVYDNRAVSEPKLSELSNFYISADMLRQPDKVLAAVKELQGPNAIMVQMKGDGGYFYWQTAIRGSKVASDINTQKIAELIEYLDRGDFYLIAQVSAFVDNDFALANTSCGFPMSGGILWVDSDYHYWLNPLDIAVQNYLVSMSKELRKMGFDEIAFSRYEVPDSENIYYGTEMKPAEILAEATAQICKKFDEAGISISFVTNDKDFPVNLCTGRVYVPNVSGPEAEQFARAFEAPGTLKEVAFIVNSKDSRFDGKAVLRAIPIDSN